MDYKLYKLKIETCLQMIIITFHFFPLNKFTFVSQDFDSNVESLEDCRSRCLASGWCEGFTWVKDNPKNGLEAKKCYLKKDVSYANHSGESAWSGFLSCK